VCRCLLPRRCSVFSSVVAGMVPRGILTAEVDLVDFRMRRNTGATGKCVSRMMVAELAEYRWGFSDETTLRETRPALKEDDKARSRLRRIMQA